MAQFDRDTGRGASSAGDLFQLLHDGRPRTRAALSRLSGLARPTVAARIDELMGLGLIRAVGDAESTGGRPSAQVALNPSARIVLAADIGVTHATVAVTDLGRTVLADRSAPLDIAQGPEPVLDWLIGTGLDLIADLGHDSGQLLAVGIGLPGPVEFSTGRPVNPPLMPGWDRFDVPGWVQRRLNVPVLVDNDVNFMALAEQAMVWPDVDDLMFVNVSDGVGAGVISDGRLRRGAQGIAGDIGHVRVSRGSDVVCACGNQGCLEALASGPAIASALREQGIDAPFGDTVVELLKLGDKHAVQAVRQAGRDIGEVLTAGVSFVNPSVIVLGGSIARAGEHFIAGVREIVYTRSMPLATEHLQIVQSALSENLTVIGASMHAIYRGLLPESIDALLANERSAPAPA